MPRREIKRRRKKIRRRAIPPKWKFTLWRKKIIYEALERNLPITRACDLADVSIVTFRDWMIRGRDEKKFLYNHFRKRVKKLQSRREAEALDIIRRCGKGGDTIKETKIVRGPKGYEVTRIKKKTQMNWQAANRFLELIAREIYGPKAEYDVYEEKKEVPQSRVNVKGEIEVESEQTHIHKIPVVQALRNLDREDLENLANVIRKLEDIATGSNTP